MDSWFVGIVGVVRVLGSIVSVGCGLWVFGVFMFVGCGFWYVYVVVSGCYI